MAEIRSDIEAIFFAARQKLPQERAAYLDDVCGADRELRQRVEQLLSAQAEIGSFLETPVVQRVADELAGQASAGSTEADSANDIEDAKSLAFLTPSEKPDSLGCLGHYEIQEVIGRGGMGIVLRAFDEKLHRVVAIKVMAAQLATNANARKRFTREAQAQAAVSHDHIVTIHAVEEANGLPYLVMQYISGMSLQQRMDRDGPLELHEILRVGMQTASGLAAAHAQGLVHRDIKPANILLENGVERVKITDFGLARAASEASLTHSGVVVGTPQYMSPEQAEGKAIDQRTDLFSLGSVLYAMCTGRAPFRASGSIAVLKRVCEEVPTPIRETNPQIPEWLAALVDKLQAKDPTQRYQSAAEVADLLGRHLAHVQHPSVAASPLSARGRGTEGEGRSHAQGRRRLAVAAAVLLCFIACLSLTEATGVTNVRATVIRILTPDGTLIVETNDPGVKVTIEGDGGLVITGAGLEEIRLRPGSYKVHANRDGKPIILDRELVSISKGGREVVKVKLAAPAPVLAKAEKGEFVLLAAGKERLFDTLTEAVHRASAGDTIEIRGNGPFDSPPITMRGALVIRAGRGHRPVIRLHGPTQARDVALFATDASLTLEGLELQIVTRDGQEFPPTGAFAVISDAAPLRFANCTLLNKQGRLSGILQVQRSPHCELRNCLILADTGGRVLNWNFSKGKSDLVMDNCLQAGGGPLYFSNFAHDPREVSVIVTRNTRIAGGLFGMSLDRPLDLPAGMPPAAFIRLEASENVSKGWWIGFQLDQISKLNSPPLPALPTAEVQAQLPRVLAWQGKRNVYSVGQGGYLALTLDYKVAPQAPIATLRDWTRFLNAEEVDSLEGQIKLQGGDLVQRAKSAAETITPEDFRLRSDSAGYKAGEDGKDLGADVALVGPGPAYERWKKSPAYQQWLKETGQTK